MKNWFLLENLKKAESEVQSKALNELDPGGDFASYKIMHETGDVAMSSIKCHNDISPDAK